MKYNFDEIINRKGTSCLKHDLANVIFNTTEDIIPMWVADMDFKSPEVIVNALKERCNHEVFGYTAPSKEYFEAVINWLKTRYKVNAKKNELHFIPGIVAGIAYFLQAFTKVGDNILITTPVYPPFINLPKDTGRNLIISKLNIVDGRFNIDFDDFEEKAKQSKVFIMSNPHNPGGTVWTKQELEKIANICYKHNVLVISDEIHADLTFEQFTHTSFSTISKEAKDISVTFIAPSKTFNIAGLSSSIAYVANQDLRDEFFGYLEKNHVAFGSVFAYTAATAAFTKEGAEWLEQLNKYVLQNVEYVCDFIDKNMPNVTYIKPEASFLVWIDFNRLNVDHKTLKDLLINEAKVGMNDGLDFGDQNDCCFRMNVGCPLSIVKQALNQILNTLKKHNYVL